MQRDSVGFTFTVAATLCVICSLLVSSAAEALRPIQERNKELDKNKNVLLAAGLVTPDADAEAVKQVFSERIQPVMVDLSTGEVMPEGEVPKGYDPRKAAKNPSMQKPVEPTTALGGIRFREPYAPVYKILAEGSEDKVEGYILPMYGKGLWSTMYGFLALEGDGQTVRGITFYEDGETPGLGGEINNPNWQGAWHGKTAVEGGAPVIRVLKGGAPEGTPAADHTIDGLSGATLTTKGVDRLVQYWLGPQGFGPYLNSEAPGGEPAGEHDQQPHASAERAGQESLQNG